MSDIKRRLVPEEWADRAHELAEIQLRINEIEDKKKDYNAQCKDLLKPLVKRRDELLNIVATGEEPENPQAPLPFPGAVTEIKEETKTPAAAQLPETIDASWESVPSEPAQEPTSTEKPKKSRKKTQEGEAVA